MADDHYLADEMKKSTCWDGEGRQSVYDFAMGGTPRLALIASDDA